MSKIDAQIDRADSEGGRPLYVIEEINGRQAPVVVTCAAIRAWARASKRELDRRSDPKSRIRRRICIYRRISVVS